MPEESSSGGIIGFFARRLTSLRRSIWPLTPMRGAVLLVLLLVVLFIGFEARSTEIISVEVVVIEEEARVGFNPTTERLDFGDMSRGTSQTRHLTVKNDGMVPTRVSLVIVGDVGDYVSMSDAFFTLGRSESVMVDLTLSVPEGASNGKHSGRLLILRVPWVS